MKRRGSSQMRRQRCRRAVASLEFALISPIMITMVLGTLEVSDAVRIQAKLNVTAGQLAEMIAGSQSVTTGSSDGSGGTLGDLCTAASYNLLPYPTGTLYGYVEATTVSNGNTGQNWTEDRFCPASQPFGSFWETIDMTSLTDSPRSLFTLDGTSKSAGGQAVNGYAAITVWLFYPYSNPVHFFMARTITFTALGVARPRAFTAPTCTYPSGNGTAPCPGVY